tara:strand:+ start:9669 stop:10799 length:1131 start_codon:yes stop_codon:yes gene_type:complete
MKKTILTLAAGVSLALFSTVSHADTTPITQEVVVQNYAGLVYTSYNAAYQDGLKLQQAIDGFLANPNDDTLNGAKQAWLTSRNSYGQTEAFRFYEGPIDFADADGNEGPEGRLNAWPLDEAYIDYVQGNPNAGLVNNKGVKITKDSLSGENQANDEAEVSTGYHAIEFLLWGQDLNIDGPGNRPVSDYAKTANNERRRAYLKVVTELVVDDLKFLVDQWAPNQDNYAKTFVQDKDALSKIMTALATLSGFELASERMATALDSGDQEDEHSCFSDNTHNDFIYNAQGIMNVFFSAGLYEYLETKDDDLAEELEEQILETKKLIAALPHPIDREILSTPKGSEARQKMEMAVSSLQKEADLFKKAGDVLGIKVSINE